MDTTKIMGGGPDPASSFLSYVYGQYVTSGTFWGMIILVFLLLWVARTFIFDNKNIKWATARSWLYPAVFFGVTVFVVWLKSEVDFSLDKKYFSDWFETVGVVSICYTAFGHKLVTWLSGISTKAWGLSAGTDINPGKG